MTYSRINAERPTQWEIEDAYLRNILTDEEYEYKRENIAMEDESDIEAEFGDNIKATARDGLEEYTGDYSDILDGIVEKGLVYAAREPKTGDIILVRTDDGEVFDLSKGKIKFTVRITQTIETTIEVEADDDYEAQQLAEEMVSDGDVDFDDWDADYDYDVEEE
jgi:hypothetical protein